MYIELPEVSILTKQMNKQIVGKMISSWQIDDLENYKRQK